MQCAYHPQVPAVGYCNNCGKAICAQCSVQQTSRTVCPVCASSGSKPPLPRAVIILGVLSGVLFLCLVGLIVAGLLAASSEEQTVSLPVPAVVSPQAEVPLVPSEQPDALIPEPATAPLPPLEQPITTPQETLSREELAIQAALYDQPEWVGVVKSHTANWDEAVVWLGPSASDLRLSRALAWMPEEKQYEVMAEGPVE